MDTENDDTTTTVAQSETACDPTAAGEGDDKTTWAQDRVEETTVAVSGEAKTS